MPAALNVCWNVPPAATLPLLYAVPGEPVALLTVCANPSPFFQVTVVPTDTVRFVGLKDVLIIQACVAVEVQVGVPPLPP